jgi:adenylate cyclase
MPIILVTAKADSKDVVAGLEAGADEYLTKPVDQMALVARVKSVLRLKELHDKVRAQATELAVWNKSLEGRVQQQVAQIERMDRLKRFLSPQIAELIMSSGDDQVLESHRRQVTVVFCDLRGFTPFAETAEPEEVMAVLREYHHTLGTLIHKYEGTVERFAGDGVMTLFNDPIQVPDPSVRAVRMATEMRGQVGEAAIRWRKAGHELGFGIGVAHGYATLGRIGFEGRFDYAAIGTVVNLAARLCADAKNGQILIDSKVQAAIEDSTATEPAGELLLKGFHRPVRAFNVCERGATTG